MKRAFADLVRFGVLAVGDGYRAKNDELGGSGPIFLRAAYLQDNGFVLKEPDRFLETDTAIFGSKVAQLGDVVVTTKGNSTGRVGRIGAAEVGSIYSPHLSYWRSLDPNILDQSFLYYWSRGVEFRSQLAGMATSTDMAPYLSLRDQLRLEITLPRIEIQRGIGRTLCFLDDKIELNRRMNETLEAMAQAIFRDWFVDFGPVRRKLGGASDPVAIMGGLTPDPARAAELAAMFPNAMGAGDLPGTWRLAPLADLSSELRRGISPAYATNVGVLVLNQRCIRDRSVSAAHARRHDENRRSVAGRELHEGDILINSTGVGTLGRVAQIWDLPERTVVDSHVTVVRARDRRTTVYLGRALEMLEPDISEMGEGSTGQTELSRAKVGAIPIVVPPDTLLDAFDKMVRPLVQMTNSNSQQNRTLAETRDYLLPRLMSGKVRVGEAAEAAEAAA